LGITQNRWDNIDDIFVAVHTQYRRMGVGKQMLELLKDIGRAWQSAESGRGARRMFLMVKDANEGSKRMVTSAGFVKFDEFLNQQGETVNKYMIELYVPPRENP
jgi:ribosomal protein S18 acetylase RimI-like enzyme